MTVPLPIASPSTHRPHWFVPLLGLLLLFLAHGMGLVYQVQPGVSLWFPAAGVAIVLTFWLGPIGIVLAGIASVIMAPYWGFNGWMRLLGLIDMIEPLIAWLFYRHWFCGSLTLRGLRDTVAFLLSTPVAACAASAVIGSLTLFLLGEVPRANLGATIDYWWVGNAIGTMAIACPALLIVTPWLSKRRWLPLPSEAAPTAANAAHGHWAEIFLIGVSLVLTACLTVATTKDSTFAALQVSLLGSIPTIWAACRFGVRGGVLAASTSTFVALIAYLVVYPNAIALPLFPVEVELMHLHKLSLLLQSVIGLMVGTAVTEQAETQAALIAEQVRLAEYQATAQLSEKLFRLNRLLNESNQQLQEGEERFRASVETMLDCFGIFSAIRDDRGHIIDFRFDYLNDAACHNNQMTREQQIGKGLCELLPQHRIGGLFQDYCQVVETGQPLVKDELMYADDFGKQHIVKAYDIRAAKFDDGFVVTWRDVTDRHQAQEELYRREQEFKALVENSPDVITRIDRTLRYLYVNPAIERATGIPLEAFVGKTIADLFADHENYGRWYAKLQETIQTQQIQTDEFDFLAPNGVLHSYHARLVPEFAQDGAVDSVLVVTRDITDRRRTEEALRQSKERLNLALQAAGMGTWDWNIQTGEIYWSTDLEQVMELAPGTFNGQFQTVIEMIHPDDRAGVLQALYSAIHNHQEFNIQFRFVKADGSIRWAISRGLVFYDSNDVATRMTGVDLDITERKQHEDERTLLLTREQAARQQAESASRLKDEFLAIVSHELRSPLNGILGWSRLLRTRKLSVEKTEQALSSIERNAQAQTQLIEDLLDISRIIRGAIRLYPRPTNLLPVLQAAIDTIRPTAAAKSIHLEAQLNLGIGLVSGDPERLQQIVWNLLSNAVKFTDAGGQVEIRLSLVTRHSSLVNGESQRTNNQGQMTNYAQITITDTGKGISAEFLPYVFDRFRQADATTTRTQSGLGLGLAIVRNLVELHGGTVHADSAGEGKGSSFVVQLPLLPAENGTGAEVEESFPASPVSDSPLQGVRVLVVDDEADTREVMVTALEQFGAIAIAAASTQAALELLRQHQPDVLLSDIGMPEEDGYALIQQIRALPPTAGGQIPAAALTAYVRGDDRQKALTAGFQMHVAKPIEPMQLLKVVMQLAERSGES